ncbi:MAG: PAS domain S-box protein, partial [Bacteroidales bacterium]|nr:PAS domain S-box protein [Bacteroidales bacterium]
ALKSEEIADIANDLIIAIDNNGIITYINKGGSKILGYKPDEIIGQNWFDNFIPERKQKTIKAVAKNLLTPDSETYQFYENEVLTKAGKERTFFWHNKYLTDGKGNRIGIISAGTDITDFKKSIKIAQESEQKFKTLFENNSSPILFFDSRSKTIIDANKSAIKFYGYPKKTLLTKTLFDLNATSEEELRQEIEKATREKRTYFLMKNRLANSDIRDVEIYSGEIKINQKPIWYAIVHDITDRKKLLKSVLKNEQRYQLLFNTLNDAVFVHPWKEKGFAEFIEVNQTACKRYGYTVKQFLKLTPADITIKKDAEDYARKEQREYLKEKQQVRFETLHITKKGKQFPVEINSSIIIIDEKPYVISIVRDITRRQKLESNLRESEITYRSLVENSLDAIILVNSQGIIHFSNLRGKNFTGYTTHQIVGKSFSEFIPKKDFSKAIDSLKKVLSGKLGITFETEIIHKNGKTTPVISNGVRIELNGEPYDLVIIRDISKEKEAQEKLLESENRYKMLADNSKDAIFFSYNGKCIDSNLTAEKMFGYSRKEAIGKPITTIIDKKYQAIVLDHVKNNDTKPYEVIAKKKDGTLFCVEIQGDQINYQGKKARVSIVRDLSERKKREKILKQDEEKFRTLFDDAVLPKLLIDPKTGKFTDANKAACKLYGYSKQQLLTLTTRNLSLLSTKEFQQQTDELLNGEKYIFYSRHKTAKGEIKDVEIFSDKLLINDTSYIFSTITDVSESLRVNYMQKKEHDLAFMGVWNFKFNTNEVIVCEHASNIYGYDGKTSLTIEEVQQVPLPQFRKTLDKALENTVKNNAPYDVELQIKRANDGALRYIHSVAEYDKDKNELFGIIQDITEHKHIETELTNKNEEFAAINEEYLVKNEELDDALKKAQESDRLKSVFLANMSHEIRTPMNGIIGFADLLSTTELPVTDQKQFLQIIKNSGEQLLQIINDILDYSKLEAGQMTVAKEKVSLMEVIHKIKIDFSKRAEEKGLDFILECPKSLNEVILETDEYKLIQILNNLLSNALKFTEKGQIFLECIAERKHIKFFVRDTGIGISPEKQAIIFERFRQADEKLSRKYGGTGLGLSISKGFVKLLGGTIGLESQQGVGTSFWFTIPYYHQKETLHLEKSGNQLAFDWSNKTFLIVEDYFNNYKFLEILLKVTGAKTLAADTGKKAIEMVRSHPEIDVVLMDIKLPDITGYKATREIRKFNESVIIIAQTAYAFENDESEALKSGCNAYISKPINRKELFQIIDTEFNNLSST